MAQESSWVSMITEEAPEVLEEIICLFCTLSVPLKEDINVVSRPFCNGELCCITGGRWGGGS